MTNNADNNSAVLSNIGMVNIVIEAAFPVASFCMLHFSIRNNQGGMLKRVGCPICSPLDALRDCLRPAGPSICSLWLRCMPWTALA